MKRMAYYLWRGKIILGKVQVFAIFPCITLFPEMTLQFFQLFPEISSW